MLRLVTQSYLTLCDPMDCSPPGSSVHRDSPGKNTGMGCHTLLQGIFPTEGLNQGLLHYRRILYHLSCQGSPLDTMYVLNFKIFMSLLPHEFFTYCASVQSLSRVQLFATPWIAARQASLSITNSWSSPKLLSIESVMPSSHLILCHPLLLLPPIPPSFPMSQLFSWGGQSTGASALASVLPKNTPDWSPLEWAGWISLQSKGLSRVFSNITVQKHQFFDAQPSSQSNSHIHTWPLEIP